MKNIRNKVVTYLQDVRKEARKISWPQKTALKQLTAFVIILIVILSIFTGLVDTLFSRLVQAVLR